MKKSLSKTSIVRMLCHPLKLFKKPKSKFYWYDFTIRGQGYRGSTNETKSSRALKIAGLRFSQVIENTDHAPKKGTCAVGILPAFSRVAGECHSGRQKQNLLPRLLQTTTIVHMRLDQITKGVAEMLKFSGAHSNANCALRTLRRMLHKAEEWQLIRNPHKLKLKNEYGRSLRLDEEAEKKLLVCSAACAWRKRSLQLSKT